MAGQKKQKAPEPSGGSACVIVQLLQQQLQQHLAAANATGAAQLTAVWKKQQADVQSRMHTERQRSCWHTPSLADSWLQTAQQQQQQQQQTSVGDARVQQQREAELFQVVLQALEEEAESLEKQAATTEQQLDMQQPRSQGAEATAKTLQYLRKGKLLHRDRLCIAADADTEIYTSSSDEEGSASSGGRGGLFLQQQQQWLRSRSLHALQQKQLLLSSDSGLSAAATAAAAAAASTAACEQLHRMLQHRKEVVEPRRELRLWREAAQCLSTPGCSFVERLLQLRSSSSSSRFKSAPCLLLSREEERELRQLLQKHPLKPPLALPSCFLSHESSSILSCRSCFLWLLLQQQLLQQLERGACAVQSRGSETHLVRFLVLQQQLLRLLQGGTKETDDASLTAGAALEAQAASAAAAASSASEFAIQNIAEGQRILMGMRKAVSACSPSRMWGRGRIPL
ncbi:uncharacterized protein LOC113147198 [Cyclospora cayetanensis]|uniref:Uncharacterized protein LOC113147198 n=1 Tax=Cyclospora cayetanensis TaxID=88456 RepID=A0A6P6RZF7_9EIME|nr:uncharacterized protein LOC113147198 [Cyclospora cayetanensis]